MVYRFSDSVFYLASAAAQVWSALMVFHILLVRDLKHHVEREIDNLWTDAKLWWPRLLLSLNSPEGLKSKLPQFGLTTDVILRADTHKNSFIRLIAAIKTHRIVSDHLAILEPASRQDHDHQQHQHLNDLTPGEWQQKFEPIAERIQELEQERPEMGGAFMIGICGVGANMIACGLGSFSQFHYSSVLLGVLLTLNLGLLGLFGAQVKRALGHFNVTSQHDAITDQIHELEIEKSQASRRRKSRKAN
jgi:hypothetical protein